MALPRWKKVLAVLLATPFILAVLAFVGFRLWVAFLEMGWKKQEARIAREEADAKPRLRAAMITVGQIEIGMTAEECRASRGAPKKINRTTTAHSVTEQWCYGESCSPALYFENGVLRSFQDQPRGGNEPRRPH